MNEWFEKLRERLTSRSILFIVAAVAVVVFMARGCSGVNITEQEAIAAATVAFEAHDGYFEPQRTEARVLRQGIPTRAVWFVLFTVPDPQGSQNDFLNRAEVQVDAANGAVLEVSVTKPDS